MTDDTDASSSDEPPRASASPTPWSASFQRQLAEDIGEERLRRILDISAFLPPTKHHFTEQILRFDVPDMSQVFAEQHRQLLEQIASSTGNIMRTLLSSDAVRAWQEQEPTTPRAGWTPRKFLSANAKAVNTLRQFTSAVATVSHKHTDHEPVWRGQGDADWRVSSTLYRAVTGGDATKVASEDDLIEAELGILASASNWGLHPLEFATAPLHVLAELQHAGAPTRLLDVTRDPEIASWFAVENPDHDDRDGLVIAWGQLPRIKRNVVGGTPTSDLFDSGAGRLPWHDWDDDQRLQRGWGTGAQAHVWFPPTPNTRMRVQRGGFMIESGPLLISDIIDTINAELSSSTGAEQQWRRSELERATSVIGLPSPIGKATTPNDSALAPIFTIVIKAEAKPAIRSYLRTRGLEPRSMYPDLAGLVTDLRRSYLPK